ncbi:MAG: hypothetical protein JSR44_11195 [Spirochaetes bacterium]|nr:hypothetical protein [Spirochaetota bacterium]
MVAEHTTATIRIHSENLNANILEGFKKMFPNQEIMLRVEPVGESFESTIERRSNELNAGNGITFTAEEFAAFVEKLP